MTFIEAVIFLLLLVTLCVPIATRLQLPLEIFLLAASGVVSLIFSVPNFQINPNIIFTLFLPPILFSAAYFTSWRDFKFNLRPIILMAVGLVLFTACMVAVVMHFLLQTFTWQEGFLLGAIIAPTDATSAVAIIKKLGAPRRLITVLEGESLVNDATALLLFRFSIAAISLGSFSLPHAVGTFFMVSIGGAVIGLGAGLLGERIIRYIKNVQAETTFTFILAFTSYLIAEHLGFSGVISTVVCGICFGLHFPEIASSSTKLNAKSNWRTLIFVINGFVFTLIGLELPNVIKSLQPYSLLTLIIDSSAVISTIILTRLVWVYEVAYLSRKIFPSIARRDPMPSWQFLFTSGWSGMRGIVSLAAALAIPLESATGVAFPQRNLLIFLTYCVIVATLLIPTLTLPLFIRIFKLKEDPEQKLKEEALARIRSLEHVMQKICELKDKEKIPQHIFYEFRKQLERRYNMLKTQLEDTPYSTISDEYQVLKKLTLTAIISEKEILFKLRKSGELDDDVFHLLSDELDMEEIRARTVRI